MALERCPVCREMLLQKGKLELLLGRELGNVADSLSSSYTSDEMDPLPAHCFACDQEMMALQGAGEIRFEWCDR